MLFPVKKIDCQYIQSFDEFSFKWFDGRGHFETILISLTRRALHQDIGK